MSKIATKFDFTQDFNSNKFAEEEQKFSAEMIEDSRLQGYAQGYAAAQSSAVQATDMKAQALFLQAAETLTQLDATAHSLTREGINIALTIARTLARGLMDKFPQDTIEELANECFRHMRNTPHISFRVAPDLAEALQERLQAQADSFGFAGRILITPDPEFATGDVRIEWADGGYEHQLKLIEAEVEACLQRWLAATLTASVDGDDDGK